MVNISSVYGNRGTPGSAVYSTTKAAVVVLSESLRLEAQGKIKVTVVHRQTGVLGTGLAGGVVNPDAVIGAVIHQLDRFRDRVGRAMTGDLTADELDVDDTRYWAITADDLVAQIVYTIDQPSR